MNAETRAKRLARARVSLEGLSVGDAFGECFFGNPELMDRRLENRQAAPAPWCFTDDTVMAVSIYRCLEEHGEIDRDRLAELFAREYECEPGRGYGGTAHSILRAIGGGFRGRRPQAMPFPAWARWAMAAPCAQLRWARIFPTIAMISCGTRDIPPSPHTLMQKARPARSPWPSLRRGHGIIEPIRAPPLHGK
jgi:hypothetical protein